jgi:hypothetical protein
MVQAFNIPTPVNYLGNAMQINRQNAQQDQQNALIQRDQSMQEQKFSAEQSAAQAAREEMQRKRKQEALGTAAMALSRLPRARREEAYQALYIDDPDWVAAVGQETANAPIQNPRLLDDFYVNATVNKNNQLTDEQKAAQARQMKEAETVPTWEWVRGPNGQPMRRAINPFSAEAGQGVVGSADPNSTLSAETQAAQQALTRSEGNADRNERRLDREARANGFGGINIKDEATLRREFNGLTSNRRALRSAYSSIRQLSNGGAQNDIGLVYQIMKMHDPTSVVRETEFATAQNAAGVPDRIRNQWNKVKSGAFLNPEQRKEIVATAENLMRGADEQYSMLSQQYQQLALASGLDPRRIVLPEAPIPPPTKPSAAPRGANLPAKNSKGWILEIDGRNRAYVNPRNRNEFEVVK